MSKEKLEKYKIALEIAGLLLGFGAAFGGFLIFLYCIGEGISPRNLSVSDTVVLLQVLFSFVAVFVIGILYGTFSMIWFVRALQLIGKFFKKETRQFVHPELSRWMLSLASLLMFALFGGITLLQLGRARTEPVYPIMAYFCANGLFVLVVLLSKSTKDDVSIKRKSLFLGFIMISTLMAFKPALMSFALTSMGVRSNPSDVVILDQKTKEELDGFFADIKRPWNVCSMNSGRHWMTKDIRLTWHGIGDISYVRLLEPANTQKTHPSEPQIPLAANGIRLMRDFPVTDLCTSGTQPK